MSVADREKLFSRYNICDGGGSSGGGGDGSGGDGGKAEYETIKTRHTLRNNLLRDFMRLGMRSCLVASEEKTSYCWRKVRGTKQRKSRHL